MTLNVMASSVLKTATSQEHYHETGTNHTKYGDKLFGPGSYEWCAAFIWWCLMQNGVDLRHVIGESNPAWVPNLERGAKNHGMWKPGHSGLLAGDIALIDTNGDGGPNHVRFVVSVYASGSYKGCGGNESNEVEVATHDTIGMVGRLRLPWKPEQRQHGPSRQPYVVKPGDTLSSIAQAHYGNANRWPEIYRTNRHLIGGNPDKLAAGLRIILP